jgi:hypothetical protein
MILQYRLETKEARHKGKPLTDRQALKSVFERRKSQHALNVESVGENQSSCSSIVVHEDAVTTGDHDRPRFGVVAFIGPRRRPELARRSSVARQGPEDVVVVHQGAVPVMTTRALLMNLFSTDDSRCCRVVEVGRDNGNSQKPKELSEDQTTEQHG